MLNLIHNYGFMQFYSNDPELIHILEENDIKVYDYEYENFYEYSIRCNHNEIENYIKDNLIKELKNVY